MNLTDKFEPELIYVDVAKDQRIYGGKLKERDINTRRRKLQFTYDGKPIDLADTTCTAYVKTPTGEVQEMNCQVNGDYAILDFPTSTRVNEGEINVEVKLATADDDVSTFLLDFDVVPALIDDRSIQSSNEFTALQELIAAIGGIGDVPKDLQLLSPSNRLVLVDSQGNRIGNGVVLNTGGGGGTVVGDIIKDLKLDTTTNNLYLIDDIGNKVGTGVILPTAGGNVGTVIGDLKFNSVDNNIYLVDDQGVKTGVGITIEGLNKLDKIPTDLDIDVVNEMLYLLDKDGTRVGNGISLGGLFDVGELAKDLKYDTATHKLYLLDENGQEMGNGVTIQTGGTVIDLTKDLELDVTENLHLVDDQGAKIGNGIDLEGISNVKKIPTNLDLDLPNKTMYLLDKDGTRVGTGVALNNILGNYDPSVINIKSFGAVGDDSTDDTASIQAAIDSVAAGTRATIYVPDGIFCINSPIKLKQDITFKGNGIGSIIKEGANFHGDSLLHTAPAAPAQTNIIVDGVELRGLKNKAVSGVKFVDAYWGTVKNCRIIDLGGNGVEFIGTNSVTETCYAENNQILYCLKNGVYTNNMTRDIHISGGDIGCHGECGIVFNALSSTITNVQAIWGNGQQGVYEAGENNQIRTCCIEGNKDYAVFNAGKKLMLTTCKFTANKVDDAAPTAHVGVDGGASKTFISDCVFLNNVDPNKPAFSYGIVNYGTDTHIGMNYYESNDKVLSAKPYTMVSSQLITP